MKKIAVTYENGQVFQHFGKTEAFKVYEVEDGKVVASEIINTNGTGHSALARILSEQVIDVLICGGIGSGAKTALDEAGIEVCAGASLDADAAVESYLKGELVSTGVNCEHHEHEEEHSCGEGCNSHGCGSGCGGCHVKPAFEGKNVGKTLRVHYTGTFDNGEKFDSSYDRNEPLEFVCGAGMMILGFDKAVANMEIGEKKDIHLMPEEAYGQRNPEAVFSVEISRMPGSEELEAGQQAFLSNAFGQPFPVRVMVKDEKTITFDANHEMAGKELNFAIELVEIIE